MQHHRFKQLTYSAIPHDDPYLQYLGNFTKAETEQGWVVRVQVESAHCNGRQITHGGFIATLADVALAYGATYCEQPPLALVTVHKSLDFTGHSLKGDILFADIKINKKGHRLIFADSHIINQDQRLIAKASAIMQRLSI